MLVNEGGGMSERGLTAGERVRELGVMERDWRSMVDGGVESLSLSFPPLSAGPLSPLAKGPSAGSAGGSKRWHILRCRP